MTTDKPEVVAWTNELHIEHLQREAPHTGSGFKAKGREEYGFHTALVRLRDYEALQAECERLRVSAKYSEEVDAVPENQLETMLYDTLAERDLLRAECERLRKDAERYKWLRESAHDHFDCEGIVDIFACSGEVIDGTIDAAMQEASHDT